MSETIEMPPVERKRRWNKKQIYLLGLLILSILCIVTGLICWLALGKIESAAGRLDGTVYTISSQIYSTMEEIYVRVGEEVKHGQILAKVEEQKTRDEVSEPLTEQLSRAQMYERQMTERLSSAQQEEERYRRVREQRVTEHVRAQLAMRSISSPNSSQYKQLATHEKNARHIMERAKEDFENSSKARAAIEKELNKIRMARKKLIASLKANPQEPVQQKEKVSQNTITSPIEGRIMALYSSAGDLLKTGQPIFVIFPNYSDHPDNIWGQAWFSREAGKALKSGQEAEIEIAAGLKVTGSVSEVFAPQPLPEGMIETVASASKTQLFVPCKIKLPPLDKIERDKFLPGMPIKCEIYTRSLFGFKGW